VSPTGRSRTLISLSCVTISGVKKLAEGTWGCSCCGQLCDLFRLCSGFDSLCARLSSPRCLTCFWACRMSSGPWGIVVVRVSWPGHPTYSDWKACWRAQYQARLVLWLKSVFLKKLFFILNYFNILTSKML
jgi:hypothetical protein